MAGTYGSCYAFQSLESEPARILWERILLVPSNRKSIQTARSGRYEKNCESFDLYAAKFESGAMRFWGKKSLRRRNPFKTRIPPLSFYYMKQSTANSNSFKIAQKTAFEAKGRLFTTGKVIQRLFIIDLYT